MSKIAEIHIDSEPVTAYLWKDKYTGGIQLDVRTGYDGITETKDLKKLIEFLNRCLVKMEK